MQNKWIAVDKQEVIFKDLGIIEYKTAWDYQEELLQANVKIKSAIRSGQPIAAEAGNTSLLTTNY